MRVSVALVFSAQLVALAIAFPSDYHYGLWPSPAVDHRLSYYPHGIDPIKTLDHHTLEPLISEPLLNPHVPLLEPCLENHHHHALPHSPLAPYPDLYDARLIVPPSALDAHVPHRRHIYYVALPDGLRIPIGHYYAIVKHFINKAWKNLTLLNGYHITCDNFLEFETAILKLSYHNALIRLAPNVVVSGHTYCKVIKSLNDPRICLELAGGFLLPLYDIIKVPHFSRWSQALCPGGIDPEVLTLAKCSAVEIAHNPMLDQAIEHAVEEEALKNELVHKAEAIAKHMDPSVLALESEVEKEAHLLKEKLPCPYSLPSDPYHKAAYSPYESALLSRLLYSGYPTSHGKWY